MNLSQKNIFLITFLLSILTLYSCDDSVIEETAEQTEDNSLILSRKGQSRNGTPHYFPNVNKIINSPVVQARMEEAWEKMKSLVDPYNHRQEVGFYIYYDHEAGTFWVGKTVIGPKVSYSDPEPAFLVLGKAENNFQVCATFHCHTPWYRLDGPGRVPGPSPEDGSFAADHNIPGILYDYDTTYLTANFPIDFPHKIHTYGPYYREPVYY